MKGVDDQIAVIGTGFSGLGMAIELKRAGREDFTVFERAESVGGTWRDNSYPGCACDVPAPLYSFSFAPNPNWSQLYAPYNEIRDYLEGCVDRFGVREKIRFGCGAASSEWDAEGQRWRILLDDGTQRTARFLVAGVGGLNRPSFPEIEGLDDFSGPVIHSAAWDHDIDLAGKRVAVIGTGASAIQLIPQLAERAAHLDVFQRTPPWVLPKIDFPHPRLAALAVRRGARDAEGSARADLVDPGGGRGAAHPAAGADPDPRVAGAGQHPRARSMTRRCARR